jgi:hypothetical protein
VGSRLLSGGRIVALALLAAALWPAGAPGQPATGPHETVDQSFTTTRPNAPTGARWSGAYHAANDPKGNPPFLRRMIFYPPPGMRIDTSVPDRCAATDAELSVEGPDACPPGSLLGSGTTEGLFFVPFDHDVVFDHFRHHLDVLNNAGEQILLVHSEGYTVVRGRVRPDGSIEYNPTTCFPAPPAGPCADDYILQLKSSNAIPPYVRRGRSYMTTPPACPAAGHWQTVIKFWWSDGSIDRVASDQPCARATARSARPRR